MEITLVRKPGGEWVAELWQEGGSPIADGSGTSACEALGNLGEEIDSLTEMCG